MHEVSDRFRAAITQSRTIVAKAHLYRQHQMIASDIPILSGSTVDDASALIRKRLTIEFAPTDDVLDLLPANYPDHGGLWPTGNELHLYTGIDFEDGTDPEYIHNGIFRVNRPQVQDDGDSIKVSVSGFDRGRTVQRAKFTTPYNIRAGVNYMTAIRDLLFSRIPWLTEEDIDFMETEYTTPVLNFGPDDDPWQQAVTMAASVGAQLYWDHHGRAVTRPEPNAEVDPPVFDYFEGEDAILTSIGRDLDDENSFNGVIVSAESTSNISPIRAEAWDTDPDSPTYYDPNNPAQSTYGANPKFITSEFVTTYAQGLAMAQSELRRELGIVEHIDFTSIVNPLHESNDVIALKRQRIHVDNVYILESINASIGDEGTMSGTTRRRRILTNV